MCMRRIEMDRLLELVRLHRMGRGTRDVARMLGMSPNTERVYRLALIRAELLAGPADALPALELLKAAVLQHRPPKLPPQQASSVDRWAPAIDALAEKGLGPRAIYDRLQLEDADFRAAGATYSSVKRYCRARTRARGVRPEDVAIPVETAPGDVAQVDFGYVGKLLDPATRTLRKAWVFVMVLGHSRHMFARIVFDQSTDTWLRLHVEAFEALGGVVRTVVPDNLKAAVIRTAFGADGESSLNRSYRELARHYGFQIEPTPPFAPEKKGKVEAGVKYVKRNFFAGRHGEDAELAGRALSSWVAEIAGRREHGSTGRRPLEVFREIEQPTLLALPARRFEPVLWKQATVHQDSHVQLGRRLYSVPWRLIGKQVWIRATAATVAVYFDDVRVATHDARGREPRSTRDEHLPEHRADLRHRTRGYWEGRADQLGPDVGALVREVFDSDDVLSQLRPVQAIVTLLERYPPDRAKAACRRAQFFGIRTYAGLKNILVQALDLQPLPIPVAATTETFRFARSAAELIHLPIEETHEPN